MCGYFHGNSNELEWKETGNPVSWPHIKHIMDGTDRTISTSQKVLSDSVVLHPPVFPGSLKMGPEPPSHRCRR